MKLDTSLLIEDTRFLQEIENIEQWIQNVCEVSWKTACLYDDALPNSDIEISIVLTDDEKIQVINKEYRGKDTPTNVISFASIDSEEIDEGVFMAGDIIISFDTTAKESIEIGFKNHFTHLLVHGMLHLAGWDHIDDDEANEMEKIEVDILSKFSIACPY